MRAPRILLAAGTLAATLAGLAWTAAAARSGDDPKPRLTTRSKGVVQRYETQLLHGFTIHVDLRLLAAQREVGDAALAELDRQLAQIERKVRAEPLAELRTIAIWLGLDDPVAPCACYHPSPEWLRQNDFDPQKAKAVEIANAANFVSWTREQPWMVLHELAHGFDDRRLSTSDGPGSQGARLEELFAAAKAAGRYDEVLQWNGAATRHYALNTSDEYFAEASEAWFGCNDFFPFVQAELLRHDPALAAFLREVWGEPLTSRG